MSHIASIGWAADLHGYAVQLHDPHGQVVDEYYGGNSRFDSQLYVPPGSSGALGEEELRQAAQQTAREMAHEHHLAFDLVWEDSDLQHNLREVLELA